jgi:hypothetical protein
LGNSLLPLLVGAALDVPVGTIKLQNENYYSTSPSIVLHRRPSGAPYKVTHVDMTF